MPRHENWREGQVREGDPKRPLTYVFGHASDALGEHIACPTAERLRGHHSLGEL